MHKPIAMTPASTPWTLELPAALLYIWPRAGAAAWDGPIARLCTALGPAAGVHRLGPGLLAVVPIGGDPGVLDTALSYGRLLAAEAADRLSGGAAEAGLLVAPGAVTVAGGEAELVADPFLDDLAQRPPELPGNEVLLTGRAARTLETPRDLRASGDYTGPSGRMVPLYFADEARPPVRLWRNPELLGRRPRTVERPRLREAVAGAVPVVRITGPIGAGKTRLALETLSGLPGTLLRAVAPAARSAEPTLEMQIVNRWLALDRDADRVVAEARSRGLSAARHRLLDGPPAAPGEPAQLGRLLLRAAERQSAAGRGPLMVVCDDLERASPEDFAVLAPLVEIARPEVLRLVLIGRPGAPWPAAWDTLPTIEVPAMSAAEAEQVADHLLAGLSAPAPVRERFLVATGGNPFFFEEGIAELIHRQCVRRSYGNFFFSGDDHTDYAPSPRLVAHVEAEGERLGGATPLRMLALAGGAAPADEVRSAAAIADPGGSGGPSWADPYLAAGCLVAAESPWGPAVAFAAPAVGSALARTSGAAATAAARHTLGELLADLSPDAPARWRAYRLLAGSAEGVDVLLPLARGAAVADAELLAALGGELAAHRERGGGGDAELALLLALLPLALRQGRLAGAEEALLTALKTAGKVDTDGKAALLLQLGRLLTEQRRYEDAERLFGEILASATDGDRRLAADCHFNLGNIALQQNRMDDARRQHQTALDERRSLADDPKALITSLTAMGAVGVESGVYSEALVHYREAEKIARSTGDDVELAFVLRGVGRALGRLGDFAAATGPLRQALALRESAGDVLGEAMARLAVAENYLDLELHRDALREAREAHFRMSLLGDTAPLGRADRLLGLILLSRRRNSVARSHLLRAFEHHRDRGEVVAAAFDRGWLLDEALTSERADEVFLLTRALADFLDRAGYPELGERLDYRLFRALGWLRARGEKVADPLPHLKRAYAALLRKAGHLDPDQRQRFLYQVPENQAILLAGTRHKLG